MTGEKETFYCYRFGQDPKIMKLGTMVFDFKNPNPVHGRLEHQSRVSDEWYSITPFQNLGYSFRPGWNGDIDIGLSEWLRFSGGIMAKEALVVHSVRAERWEIDKKPQFFNDVILSDERTKEWIRSCLSVARTLYVLKKMTFQKPSIWLLTGIWLLEDAKFGSVKSTDGHAGVAASAPEVLGQLSGLSPGISVKVGNQVTLTCDGQSLGKTVWAGQWVRLKATFLPHNYPHGIDELRLDELRHFGGPLRNKASGHSDELGQTVRLSLDDDPDQNDYIEADEMNKSRASTEATLSTNATMSEQPTKPTTTSLPGSSHNINEASEGGVESPRLREFWEAFSSLYSTYSA